MELNLHLQKNNENVEQSILPQGQIATYFTELKRVATELGITNIDENALYLQAMSMPSLNSSDHSQDNEEEIEVEEIKGKGKKAVTTLHKLPFGQIKTTKIQARWWRWSKATQRPPRKATRPRTKATLRAIT